MSDTNPIRVLISYLLWPLLFGLALYGTQVSIDLEVPFLGFNCVYLTLFGTILLLERVFPHEQQWERNDGQIFPDLAHTVFNKGAVQGVVYTGTVIGLGTMLNPGAGGHWPSDWPFLAQMVLGLVLVEFGYYWAHRLGHELPVLWRFHAVHHSAPRLWVVNTGRFHFVDTLISASVGFAVVWAAGIPQTLVIWGAAIHAYIGLLTHCNIEMRFGVLSYLMNTPELHRWHHSPVLAEGNTNYGQNLPLWDLVFGTYFNPAARRPPARIGIRERMPAGFLGQLAAPFIWTRLQKQPPADARWLTPVPASGDGG